MAISLTGGTQITPEGSFNAVETLTQSTATAEQSVSLTHQVSTLSGGTATGFSINRYNVGAAAEGTQKLIVMSATGEAYVRFGAATTNLMATGSHYFGLASATGIAGSILGQATGAFVLGDKNDYIRAQYWDSEWHVLGGFGTIATAT